MNSVLQSFFSKLPLNFNSISYIKATHFYMNLLYLVRICLSVSKSIIEFASCNFLSSSSHPILSFFKNFISLLNFLFFLLLLFIYLLQFSKFQLALQIHVSIFLKLLNLHLVIRSCFNKLF